MSKWKPRKKATPYFYLSMGLMGRSIDIEEGWVAPLSDIHKKRVELGNIFRTKAEALSAKKKIQSVLKGGEG